MSNEQKCAADAAAAAAATAFASFIEGRTECAYGSWGTNKIHLPLATHVRVRKPVGSCHKALPHCCQYESKCSPS